MTVSPPTPRIDYLARDYASLRQMLLDRLALDLPGWTERSPADLEIALVELLAYAGDYLSYAQDAVAAEAYLDTARQRISLRRHARLLDYALDEGLNARTWVHLETADDHVLVPAGTRLLTQTIEGRTLFDPDLFANYDGMVFETMHAVELMRAGNRMELHMEPGMPPTLAAGATRASLHGHQGHLRQGDVLAFEAGGTAAGSHIVRLNAPPVLREDTASPVTEIAWSDEDALAAPLALTRALPGGGVEYGVCVVRGNLVLADEGRAYDEALPRVAAGTVYAPRLTFAGIAHAQPYEHEVYTAASAAATLRQDPQKAVALIVLEQQTPLPGQPPPENALALIEPPMILQVPRRWSSRRDLLVSDRFARDFVAEIDNEGMACLRFGDDTAGRKPAPGTSFRARLRVGAGTAGNVGVGAIRHLVGRDTRILSVRNPLPAVGGTLPEQAAQVRTDAPQAFRAIQLRCITKDDYVRMACLVPGVTAARAKRTWQPGSTWLAQVVVEVGGSGPEPLTAELVARAQDFLAQFARIGDVLTVRAAQIVRLELRLAVITAAGFALEAVLGGVRAAVEASVAAQPPAIGARPEAAPWVRAARAVPGATEVRAELVRLDGQWNPAWQVGPAELACIARVAVTPA